MAGAAVSEAAPARTVRTSVASPRAGALTKAAILGGLFVNLHFLTAGALNPSAFSNVIPVVLLLASIGVGLRLDARRAPRVRSPG